MTLQKGQRTLKDKKYLKVQGQTLDINSSIMNIFFLEDKKSIESFRGFRLIVLCVTCVSFTIDWSFGILTWFLNIIFDAF